MFVFLTALVGCTDPASDQTAQNNFNERESNQSNDFYPDEKTFGFENLTENKIQLVINMIAGKANDDGFVINPEKWDPFWLEFDYIGAPWEYSENSYIDPWGNHVRVGNGGFSLRSKKLLEVPLRAKVPWDINWGDFYKHMNAGLASEDGNICVHNRHIYEVLGCKFAPVNVAARFSHERPTPETKGITPFGFHYFLPEGTVL